MARGKKSSTLGRNEFTFSGRKHQVAIPETNLYVLKNDHHGQKRIKIQACWSSFRIFHSYNAIIDPTIDCLALVKKSIAAKAAKYQVADIIPLKGWKDGVVVFAGLKVEDNEQGDIPMLITDLPCDMVLGRKWLEKSNARLKNGNLVWLDDTSDRHQEFNQLPAKEGAEGECLHPDIRPRQEGRMANDLTISTPETPKGIPICEKLVVQSPSPETAKNISVYQEEVDRLVDDLKEDTCRSRLPITDDQRSQPLVQLPRRDDARLCRPDDNLVTRMPEAPVVTSGENWIAADEDMVVVRPLVQLPGCRRHDKREEFGENILSLHAEEVLRHQCQDVKNICQKDTLSLSSSLLSPLSPLLEEANEKWPCHHFLGLDPAQEASLVLEAWNEMLNSCCDDSISGDKDDLTRPSGCSESQREIDNVMQPHHFIPNLVQVDIFEGHAESYSDHDSGFDCDRVTFPTQDPEFGDNKIAIAWSPKEVFGFQTLTNNALNYEDPRVNGVFNDQDHTTQVALLTLENHPWPSSDLKCDDTTFLTSSSGFEVDRTDAFMSSYGTLVEAVWNGVSNSGPEDLMPKVEFRIAEPQ